VEVLANITPSSSKHPGGEEECFLLKECLQELILWGEGFEGEELGTALNRSPFLRDTTIQFLCGVGKELVQGMEMSPKYIRLILITRSGYSPTRRGPRYSKERAHLDPCCKPQERDPGSQIPYSNTSRRAIA